MVESIYSVDGEDISEAQCADSGGSFEANKKRLRKVKCKLKKYKRELKDDLFCFKKKERKQIKKKVRKLRKKKKRLQAQINDIKRRLDKHDEDITLIAAEVLRIQHFYRRQILQKMAEADDPKVIEGYLPMLESGDMIGR